jgi:DNA-binding HxlR family transcriptional regulator
MNSRRSIYCLRGYGALARTDYKEVPPRVDYALTPLGRSVADAIGPHSALCTASASVPPTVNRSG